ncbi:hypothetical protein CLV97_1554 [Planifilum fimeticola]|uniref:Uncharacterized protein n=1 Tax=Planifilum fimeticola TaxID=201975 RepID=A0A2T0L9V2_9BACL|nr:hypothetical protein CLV97_1554 [Planifilum fimeticola]
MEIKGKKYTSILIRMVYNVFRLFGTYSPLYEPFFCIISFLHAFYRYCRPSHFQYLSGNINEIKDKISCDQHPNDYPKN